MFQVAWAQTALDELAGAWTRADSSLRQTITVAVHALEQQLRTSPRGLGESRAKERRIVFYPPLALTFEVDEQRREVRVLHVNCYRRRRS